MEIQESVALAPLTTFGIGGPARFFAKVTSQSELFEALEFAKREGTPLFILGGGSNILVDDAGFNGLVLKIEYKGVEMVREGETALLVAASGENWEQLVARAVAEGLWGIENLSGVPGSVGGAVVQNIGAYGAALSETLEWVEVFDTTEQKTRTLTNANCKFGYRDSIFKQEPGRYVVLNAAFRLSSLSHPNLSYKDLAQTFGATIPPLARIREAVLEIRKKKFPDLTREGTAGSFFKNPVVPAAEAKKLQEKYPDMPVFSLPESGDIKIPLGWILDHVLNLRGFTQGQVRLYENQALVIVAEKNASSNEVKSLASLVQEKVFDACKISIEPEVFFVK